MFAAPGIPVHVVNHDECDDFYRANVGSTVLGVCTQCITVRLKVKSKFIKCHKNYTISTGTEALATLRLAT